MFEKALKQKLRFVSAKGNLTTEDLFQLPLTQLNDIAVAVNKKLKESDGESFISIKTDANETDTLRLDILKHIIKVKMEASEAAKLRLERNAKKAHIMELMAQKQDEALGAKSLEELQKELDALAD